MKELELLNQKVGQLQAHELQMTALLEQKDGILEQQNFLLAEQSATIQQQEAKLEAQQLEINRLIQQAFGRRSERYLENPQHPATAKNSIGEHQQNNYK